VNTSLKTAIILLFIAFLSGCNKEITVTSIGQIPGTWRWESTCGGADDTCIYRSDEHYATIEFRSDGKYVEYRNDTLYLQTNYILENSDDIFGSLILENPSVSYPIVIMDNKLYVTRGSYMDGYRKIKK
jgi:hypothetical protein